MFLVVTPLSRALLVACTALSTLSAAAQQAATSSPSAPQVKPTSTSPAGEPGTRRLVIEDDSTRIDELHVRGEARLVVVQSKRTNLPAWEIHPDSPGRTSAGETRLPRDTANTRMWRVWSF